VSALGFVLHGDPSLRDDVVHTALSQIPVVGGQLRDQVHPLAGSGVALAVGLAGTLSTGLAVSLAVGRRAFTAISDVPRVEQPSGLKARVRPLAVLAVLAAAFTCSSAAAGLAAGGGIGPAGGRAAAVVISFATDICFFLALFALLTPRPWRIRDLLPGVALAGLGWLVLQSVGGWYVDLTVAGASSTYGSFALVIGLLSWFLARLAATRGRRRGERRAASGPLAAVAFCEPGAG